MITFQAYMVDVTNSASFEYTMTFGKYVGSQNIVELRNTSFQATDIDFSYNAGNNIARILEDYVKRAHSVSGVWPLVRIYNVAVNNYYFEWSHTYPHRLKMVTPDRVTNLEQVLHFDENYTWDSGVCSYSWCTVDTIEELTRWVGDVQFGSIFTSTPRPQILPSTAVTVDVSNVEVTYNGIPSECYVTGAGTYIGGYVLGSNIQEVTKDTAERRPYYGVISNITATTGSGTRPGINKRFIVFALGAPGKKLVGYSVTLKQVGGSVIDQWFEVGDFSENSSRLYNGKYWMYWGHSRFSNSTSRDEMSAYNFEIPFLKFADNPDWPTLFEAVMSTMNPSYDTIALDAYAILTASGDPGGEPGSDVDPTNPDAPTPGPIEPDDPDPYYDPSSDPDNPDYDPTKDPDSPEYDPTQPHTPYRPPSDPGGGDPPVQQPQDPVPVPEIPPAFVTNNSMFTLYNPSAGDLNSLAAFLWSPQWSIDTFKKIFANPLDCILGLMVMPHLSAPTSTKEMAVGNIATGVTMRFFTNQFYDFDCGTFKIEEFYASYLDYAPYTKVNIFLPYIGDQQLDTDEVMNKTIGVKYRFDIATGDCVAFITVDGDVLYSYSGNCASRLPLSGNNWSGMLPAFTGAMFAAGSMAAGVPALGAGAALAVTSMKQNIAHTGSMSGSPGLMGIQKPYLIITRPRQALPLNQNSYTGYPSFMTESLGSLSGYTEVEACHLEHVPCTAEELEEIERLLKEGVLF